MEEGALGSGESAGELSGVRAKGEERSATGDAVVRRDARRGPRRSNVDDSAAKRLSAWRPSLTGSCPPPDNPRSDRFSTWQS